jgi:capsular polysaccharide export protein
VDRRPSIAQADRACNVKCHVRAWRVYLASMTDRLPVRRFLFLQGPASPFFARVARELRRSGAKTLRVGTCPGDRLFWLPGAGDYIAFRKPPEDWPETARAIMKNRAVTDLVCLGDGRPFHRDAIGVARDLGPGC